MFDGVDQQIGQQPTHVHCVDGDEGQSILDEACDRRAVCRREGGEQDTQRTGQLCRTKSRCKDFSRFATVRASEPVDLLGEHVNRMKCNLHRVNVAMPLHAQ